MLSVENYTVWWRRQVRKVNHTWFNGRHKRYGGRLTTLAVRKVGHSVSLVEGSASWPRLWQQVARVVKAKVGRTFLTSTWTRLTLTVQHVTRIALSSQLPASCTVSEWVSRFLTAHRHTVIGYTVPLCWSTLENTGQKTNKNFRQYIQPRKANNAKHSQIKLS